MERPNPETVDWYEAAIPADPRVMKGQMFAHPCAFVNRNMFFGTFGQSVIVRLGETRAASLVKQGPGRVFEPMPARPWREYVQFDRGAVPATVLARLAAEALEHTSALPPKPAKKPRAKAKAAATPKSKR